MGCFSFSNENYMSDERRMKVLSLNDTEKLCDLRNLINRVSYYNDSKKQQKIEDEYKKCMDKLNLSYSILDFELRKNNMIKLDKVLKRCLKYEKTYLKKLNQKYECILI